MCEAIGRLIGERVVLDTDQPIIYVGDLAEVSERTFVLRNADVHDCRDGHATKEEYVAEAAEAGISPNRNEVIVMRSIVISMSRLADVTG